MSHDNYLLKAKRVIDIEIEAAQALREALDESFIQSIDILKSTLDNHGKIVVIGVGKSGNIGHKIAATLNSTGATAVVLNSQNALHGDLGILSDGDAVIALSYSGETIELLELLPFIKRFQVKLIAITGKPHSTLAQEADTLLHTPVKREACPLNLAPTSSSTAALIMGDALAMVLLDARGFTDEDFARFHPGGSLGRTLLTRVSDIMRSDQNLATVSTSSSVQDALTAMNTARAGACVVLTDTKELAGVFTHGDFARSYAADSTIGDKPIAEHMTKKPITVYAHALAAEALKTISQFRVDDIVVLDKLDNVVGLIDTQDFARLKLI